MFKFDMGAVVKDEVTGFTGMIVGRTEWYNGCIRYSVQSQKLNKDGNPGEYQQFDEEQLSIVKKSGLKMKKERTGGPRPAAMRGHDVSRF